MKLKRLTLFFGMVAILFGISTAFYYVESKNRDEVIADRELTITNYIKVINAIGKSGGISIDKLKNELKVEFEIEKIGDADYSKEYYYILYPKQYDVNHMEILGFMGLELILDEQKKFKTVNMYKP